MANNITSSRGFTFFSIAFASIVALSIVANIIVGLSTDGRIFHRVADLPHRRVALLMGTSNLLRDGGPNPFFMARIQASAALYFAGRVDYVLASGDNQHVSYNEPIRMRDALMEMGVPKEKIILDYAGFSTLDSIVRAHEVFGQSEVTVVSQGFQNERAIFLGKYKGLDVIAYNAEPARGYTNLGVNIREYLARLKAMLDVFIFETEPHFLGDPVDIE